jgi:Rieske Fe-S protein
VGIRRILATMTRGADHSVRSIFAGPCDQECAPGTVGRSRGVERAGDHLRDPRRHGGGQTGGVHPEADLRIRPVGIRGGLHDKRRAPILDGHLPSILEEKSEGPLSETEIQELERQLNVLSTHCAHLGCPVRWMPEEGGILCPCHGGIYDINGNHTGGPPPHGLWRYVSQIREDGRIFVKHEFYVEQKGRTKPGIYTKPYVV